MKEEIMFVGMDIPNEIEKVITELDNSITKGMTENDIKAYKFGVNTTISLLKQLMNTVDDELIIHIEGKTHQEEIDLNELRKIVKTNKN